MVFSWMSALSVIGILTVQFLVCFSVVVFFHQNTRGISIWKRLIAPVVSMTGLSGSVVLVIENLPLLSGSNSPLVAAFPYLVALVGVAGVVLAFWLKSSRPTVYSSLGRVFEV